jgi:S1-C subfamily serine protease
MTAKVKLPKSKKGADEKNVDRGTGSAKNKETKQSKGILKTEKKKKRNKRAISCIVAGILVLMILCVGIALGGIGVPKVQQWLIDHNFTSEKTILLPSEDAGKDTENSENSQSNDSESINQEIVIEENMFVEVVDKVRDGVVSIAISGADMNTAIGGDDSVNIGTGFVIDSSGLIMTNQHVVSLDQSNYMVVTSQGKRYEVQDIARDNVNDIAILKVDTPDLKTLTIGDSDRLQVGQYVVAIGNPLGEFPGSVTTGIVSGLGRSITASSKGTAHTYENVIQTDAAINPGNSGGPLLDSRGNVVGVNFATTSGADNLSFAIPINSVTERIGEYKQYGKFIKPYLGVEYAVISPVQARFYRNVVAGAFVRNVVPGSPADNAGVKSDDIITKVDGDEVGSSLYLLIQKHDVGDKVELEIWREGDTFTREVELAEAPD